MADWKAKKGELARVTTEAWRKWGTDEDRQAWRESDASKGMTDAGETKLPPLTARKSGEELGIVKIVNVVTKSCRTSYYGKVPTKCSLVIDAYGVYWYCYKAALSEAYPATPTAYGWRTRASRG